MLGCLLDFYTQVERLFARVQRQQTEANTQGKLRMAAMTETAQLQSYADRLRTELGTMRAHGSGAMQELASRNKAQVRAYRWLSLCALFVATPVLRALLWCHLSLSPSLSLPRADKLP